MSMLNLPVEKIGAKSLASAIVMITCLAKKETKKSLH